MPPETCRPDFTLHTEIKQAGQLGCVVWSEFGRAVNVSAMSRNFALLHSGYHDSLDQHTIDHSENMKDSDETYELKEQRYV